MGLDLATRQGSPGEANGAKKLTPDWGPPKAVVVVVVVVVVAAIPMMRDSQSTVFGSRSFNKRYVTLRFVSDFRDFLLQ